MYHDTHITSISCEYFVLCMTSTLEVILNGPLGRIGSQLEQSGDEDLPGPDHFFIKSVVLSQLPTFIKSVVLSQQFFCSVGQAVCKDRNTTQTRSSSSHSFPRLARALLDPFVQGKQCFFSQYSIYCLGCQLHTSVVSQMKQQFFV